MTTALRTASPRAAIVGDAPALDDELQLVQRWLALAGAKWALPVLDALSGGPLRFNALLARLETVSPKVLTQTLRRLRQERLVAVDAVGSGGRRYALTPLGRQLAEELAGVRLLARSDG